MSKSHNDANRKMAKSFEHEVDMRRELKERKEHIKEKRMRNAIHSLDIDTLMGYDEDF